MAPVISWFRLRDGKDCVGGSLLFAPRLLFTARHCLRPTAGESQVFVERPGMKPLAATVLASSQELDVALLEVSCDPEIEPSRISTCRGPGARWQSSFKPEDRMLSSISGEVEARNPDYATANGTLIPEGILTLVYTGGDYEFFNGYSGAPVEARDDFSVYAIFLEQHTVHTANNKRKPIPKLAALELHYVTVAFGPTMLSRARELTAQCPLPPGADESATGQLTPPGQTMGLRKRGRTREDLHDG